VTNKDAMYVHFHPGNKWNQHGPDTDVTHWTINLLLGMNLPNGIF